MTFIPSSDSTSAKPHSWMALAASVIGGLLISAHAVAQEQVLNLYSARHYPTDEALYSNFTKATGIRIARVDADDAGILARLKAEGAASPADLILLVDAARLWRAEVDGLFQPVKSPALEAAIPANLRAKAVEGGTPWFGLSTRARVVVYDKLSIKREDVDIVDYLKSEDPDLYKTLKKAAKAKRKAG